MTKISLVMSGAVSLGSYHAGVLTELLYALDFHRRNGRGYELDVLTGASAGSITGALVGYAVMNNYARRDGLHKAWVELASIDRMLTDPPANAVLNPAAVRRIAQDCLPPPLAIPAPASFAPDRLRLGFTLSNLTGMNRQVRAPGNPDRQVFDSTFFDDVRTYRVVRGRPSGPPDTPRRDWSGEDPATWADVAAFGIASGTFPLAFPPVGLTRLPWEMVQLADPLTDPRTYTYVDGGTFNNQPIAEAVRLSREADDGDPAPDRKYLFVNAAARNDDLDDRIKPDSAMWDVARRLAVCIFAQSRTSDWIRALLIDSRVVWRDGFFERLRDLVRDNTLADPAGFAASLRQFAGEVVGVAAGLPGARQPPGGLDEQLRHTADKFKPLLDSLPADGTRRKEVLTLLYYVFDHVADLDERKKINIWILSPPEAGLAGTQLEWFGGFFKQEWREFNFRKGRILTHEKLQDVLGAYPPDPGAGDGYTIPAAWRGFPTQTMADTDRGLRERFREAVVARVEGVAGRFQPTGFKGWALRQVGGVGGIVGGYVREKLNGPLEL